MMRNNKKHCLLIVLSVMVLVMNLTGCQLAIDEDAMNKITKTADTLIGAFVTLGELSEQIPEDVNKPIVIPNEKITKDSKGNITINDYDMTLFHNTEYEGYLYDENKEMTVKFDGLKGYFMGFHSYVDKNGEKSTGSLSDDKFHDLNTKISIIDEVQEDSLEATLSASMNLQEIITLNPVYLRSDGTYYTISGSSFHTLGSVPGNTYSIAIDNTLTHTEDGVSNANKHTFKVNIKIVEEVKQIFIKEMNGNNELIKFTEYLRDDPEEYAVDPKTEYIIIEDIMSNDSNDNMIKRSIYNIDQDTLDDTYITHPCYFSEEDNILGGKSIRFVR